MIDHLGDANKKVPDHAQPQKSAFAETLNDLVEMQESFIYAARRGVLQRAEQLIAQLEKERDEALQRATQAHAAGRREGLEAVEQQREEAGWVSRSYMDEALALKDKAIAQIQDTLAARCREMDSELRKEHERSTEYFDLCVHKDTELAARHASAEGLERVVQDYKVRYAAIAELTATQGQQLATVTAERDGAVTLRNDMTCEAFACLMEMMELDYQLAAAQARCREMEQKLNQSQEDF